MQAEGQTTTTAKADKPGDDLEPGDYIRITGWCGVHERVVAQVFEDGAPALKAVPNTNLTGCVMQILAVDYPHALVFIWSTSAKELGVLRLNEVDYKHCPAAYVNAMLEAHAHLHRRGRPWLRRLLGF